MKTTGKVKEKKGYDKEIEKNRVKGMAGETKGTRRKSKRRTEEMIT